MGFNETEVNFLRKVLWDVHNMERTLEPGYRLLLEYLDELEGVPMPPHAGVRVGPPLSEMKFPIMTAADKMRMKRNNIISN